MRILSLPGNESFAERLAKILGARPLAAMFRRFPDQEAYVRIDDDCRGDDVVVVCTLDRPDDKFLQLAFTCRLLRDLGAASVTLVAPYLCYMRQDKVFQGGEGVTAQYFADLLGPLIDGLVTIDPHLHRIDDLGDFYGVRATTVHAAPAIADWVRARIDRPVFVGPDIESKQWVSDVASHMDAPYLALEKERHGDRNVEVSVPQLADHADRTPVIIDDIISTARTMIETVKHLNDLHTHPPVCIGVHAIFADDAFDALEQAGAAQIVSTNTISHTSNAIDVSELIADALRSA